MYDSTSIYLKERLCDFILFSFFFNVAKIIYKPQNRTEQESCFVTQVLQNPLLCIRTLCALPIRLMKNPRQQVVIKQLKPNFLRISYSIAEVTSRADPYRPARVLGNLALILSPGCIWCMLHPTSDSCTEQRLLENFTFFGLNKTYFFVSRQLEVL
jgi:hypothetical protein